MGLIEAAASLRLWPVILIGFGAWKIIEHRESGRTTGGYVLVIVGTLLLLNNWGLVRVRFWELIWPAIIIFVGAKLIMQTRGKRRDAQSTPPSPGDMPPRPTASGSGRVSLSSIFGNSQRASNDRPFRGGDMTSIVGGTRLDLRQATIEPGGEAVIDVFTIMGGHEIWVPPGWTVVSEVIPVLGSVEDKRLPAIDATPVSSEAQPRLVLQGLVMLGGLIVKN
jgi:predicted membrane protein